MNTRTTKQLVAVATLVAAVLPAQAVNFDFYKLGRGVANGDYLPENPFQNSNGDNVSPNPAGSALVFKNGGITVNATGTRSGNAAWVVQDHESSWDAVRGDGAGLGVYKTLNPLDSSDDNITADEVLTITFDRLVNLTGIGLANEGHITTWADASSTFLLDGVSTTLPSGTGLLAVNLTGTTFTFAYGGAKADQFYLSSLTATAVPDGGATFALFGLGLLAVGASRRFVA